MRQSMQIVMHILGEVCIQCIRNDDRPPISHRTGDLVQACGIANHCRVEQLAQGGAFITDLVSSEQALLR